MRCRRTEPSGRRTELSALGSRLSALGSRLSALGSRLSALGSRLSALGSRLSALGSRLSALGSRLSALGSRLSALGSRLSALGSLIMPASDTIATPGAARALSAVAPSKSFMSIPSSWRPMPARRDLARRDTPFCCTHRASASANSRDPDIEKPDNKPDSIRNPGRTGSAAQTGSDPRPAARDASRQDASRIKGECVHRTLAGNVLDGECHPAYSLV